MRKFHAADRVKVVALPYYLPKQGEVGTVVEIAGIFIAVEFGDRQYTYLAHELELELISSNVKKGFGSRSRTIPQSSSERGGLPVPPRKEPDFLRPFVGWLS